MSKYSRDQAAAALFSYYSFLTTLPYIPSSAVLTPPAEGWQDVNAPALRRLGKSEKVIDLLRHIPYISKDGWSRYKIANDTTPILYTNEHVRKTLEDERQAEGTVRPYGIELPADVISLTSGGRYGIMLLIDTDEGGYHECFVT